LSTPIFLVQKMKAITPTEKRVLELIANGYSTHDVASALAISKYTVLSHRRSLLGKFGVKNSVQLVTKAIRSKVIDLNDRQIPNQNYEDLNGSI
jgi:DNA-binding CsgD family transcriptional regulator